MHGWGFGAVEEVAVGLAVETAVGLAVETAVGGGSGDGHERGYRDE